MTATLAEFPEKTQTAEKSQQSEAPALEGVQVEKLNSDMAQQLNLPPGTRGVVITRVDPNSAVAETGLERGDVSQEVNRKPVNNVEQFRAAVRAATNQPSLLLVNRGGNPQYVFIPPKSKLPQLHR